MASPNSYSIEPGQESTPAARRLSGEEGLSKESNSPRISADYRSGKGHIRITAKRGESLGLCASMHPEYLCCRVHVLQSVSNCPYDCSYCFLQNYLTDATTQVVGDTVALLAEVDAMTAREPWRLFRIGAWELGDSLALEPQVGTSAELVSAFATMPNALLELKTKSANVEGLLGLTHNGRTVVSWTFNPPEVIKREELHTASLDERIEAMRRVAEAGYPVALHFDPMIHYSGWEEGYTELVERIFAAVPAKRIAWISIGSLRFNPEMKRLMEENFPGSRITSAEMVSGSDNKVRYVKPLRLAMYRHLIRTIRECGGAEIFTYLCMERWDMWRKVLSLQPESSAHVDFLLTESLHRRFEGMVHRQPDRELYESSIP